VSDRVTDNRVTGVRAAGGLLWNDGGGVLRVLVVHRPHYDDWTFPKGKHEPGEDDLVCAVREVTEETGFTFVVGDPLPEVDYVDHKGRAKTVAYWAMRLAEGSGEFLPNDEVDEVRWLGIADARSILTYDLDRHLLQEFAFQRGHDA